MTEPDEALLWARDDYAKQFRSRRSHVADSILSGFWDIEVEVRLPAHGYRAGAAVSAERIKELEAALGHFLGSYCDTAFWDVENEPEVIAARALLKESDQ